MSAAATHVEQPALFAFTPDNLKRAQKIISKYPQGREQSAVLPVRGSIAISRIFEASGRSERGGGEAPLLRSSSKTESRDGLTPRS